MEKDGYRAGATRHRTLFICLSGSAIRTIAANHLFTPYGSFFCAAHAMPPRQLLMAGLHACCAGACMTRNPPRNITLRHRGGSMEKAAESPPPQLLPLLSDLSLLAFPSLYLILDLLQQCPRDRKPELLPCLIFNALLGPFWWWEVVVFSVIASSGSC